MLGLLPWEKWLPPYVFGPVMCIGSICILVFARGLSWGEMLPSGFCVVHGALGTWVWLSTGGTSFGLLIHRQANDVRQTTARTHA